MGLPYWVFGQEEDTLDWLTKRYSYSLPNTGGLDRMTSVVNQGYVERDTRQGASLRDGAAQSSFLAWSLLIRLERSRKDGKQLVKLHLLAHARYDTAFAFHFCIL